MNDIISLVQQLTLLEKAALLSGANTWQTREIPRLGIPAVWMSDGPHGVRKQVGSADHLGLNDSESATCFPTAATVACSWDDQLAEQIGHALGREASEQGVAVLLGPGLNIKRSPLGGRNFEYFSEDPELAGRLAAAYVRGIQSEGVAATPKHFAVNSQELRRMVNDSVVDERTLREIYLTAFEIVVREARPWAIMSAYNLVNGTYAHENAHLLTDILREEWGFDGAVISDWGGGNDPVVAVRAGGTLEMPSPGFDSARAIVTAVEQDVLDEADLDARVGELLTLVDRVTRDVPSPPRRIDQEAHHALARRAAAESAVLLRNEGALLPLEAGTRVALIGDFVEHPRFQGAGSSLVNATRITTLAGAAELSPLNIVGSAKGFHRDGRPDDALVAEAVALAGRAEVAILALGLPEIAESEGLDRAVLELPAAQVAVLAAVHAANPRTIVLLSAGGVVTMPWLEQASAIVHGHLGGQAGAEAFIDVVTGSIDPGGRLAETFPYALADTPTAERFPSTLRTAEYREGCHVGYRYYEAAQIAVAFPFGFGLSYTSFAYADLEVTQEGATITVTNTGNRDGSDVVQLYIGGPDASAVERPVRELKGYSKVRLSAGESRRVTIPFGPRAFRHFDTPAGVWLIEAGTYDIAIGRNTRDIVLTGALRVGGTHLARVAAQTAPLIRDDDADFVHLLGRPAPEAQWGRGPLAINDPIDRLAVARSGLARFAFRLLDARRRRAEEAGTPDLNILFIFNGPFRVISKMSGGLATRALADAVLVLVNGRTLRGLGVIVGAFFRGRRAERASRDAFRAAAEEDA